MKMQKQMYFDSDKPCSWSFARNFGCHWQQYPLNITRWQENTNFMFEWQEQYETLFLPREHKIYIFEPTCNVLFIIYYMEKPIQQKQKAGIVTSALNDTTLTKVTYGKYATRVPDEVAYGIYEWFSSQ